MTSTTIRAFQDFYAADFSHCFGCGRLNPKGHHLKSYWDGDETVARFRATPEHSGGVPEHVYGGLIASLLDCHGAASAAAYACRAAGIEMADSREPVRFVTASLKVEFRRPTPIGSELVIQGRLRAMEGRKVWVDLTLCANGDVCATGEMLAIRLKVDEGDRRDEPAKA